MWVSTAIRAGLATGITAAFAEIAANLWKAPPVLASPRNLAIVVGSSIAVLVTGHVLAWLATERGLARLTGDQARSIQAPVRLGVAVFLVVLPVATTVREINSVGLLPVTWPRLIGTLAISAWAGFVVFAAARRWGWTSRRPAAAWLAAGPWLGLMALTAAWIGAFGAPIGTGWLSLAIWLLLVALGGWYWWRQANIAGGASAGWRSPAASVFSLAAGLGVVSLSAPGPRSLPALPPDAPRHIVLITVDTLRRDHLSIYSEDAPPTPGTEKLAADSLIYERAVSPSPWTKPSVVSIMTGLSPSVHGVIRPDDRVSSGVTTLAERLAASGYRTGAVGLNTFLTAGLNLVQGFDDYQMFPEAWSGAALGASLARKLFPRTFAMWPTSADLTHLALEWARAHQHEPFFLWLHYLDPHLPYEPPADLVDRLPRGRLGPGFDAIEDIRIGRLVPTREEKAWIAALYAGEVRLVDREIGRLIEGLSTMGVYDQALVVLTSDHGEELWEHRGFEHGHSLHREVLDVPLLVHLPGGGRTGRIRDVVSTERVTPTILDVAGIESDDSHRVLPLMAGHDPAPAGQVVSTGLVYFRRETSVSGPDFKYIVDLDTGKEVLFDVERDPRELRNLAHDPDEADRLDAARALLAAHEERAGMERANLGTTSESGALDPEAVRQLRSLGYVR